MESIAGRVGTIIEGGLTVARHWLYNSLMLTFQSQPFR